MLETEIGILVGVVSTFVLMMLKMNRPHVAEVGRVGTTEHFRYGNRYDVHTTPEVFAFRVDAPFLNASIMEHVRRHREGRYCASGESMMRIPWQT